MNFFDRNTGLALNLKDLIEEIQPVSDLGRKLFKSTYNFKPGEEKKLEDYFLLLNNFIKVFSSNVKLLKEIQINITHTEDINLILMKIQNKQVLEIFEIYEVKNFIFFNQKICKLINNSPLKNFYQIPDFSLLFNFLDQEGQKTPSFYLSSNYSVKLCEIRDKIAENSRKKKTLLNIHWSKIMQELELDSIEEKISVSRYNKSMLEKLEKSSYFSIESENFANIIFKVRETKEIISIESKNNKLLKELTIIEQEVRKSICQKINNEIEALILATKKIANLDLILAKCMFSINNNCSIPLISTEKSIKITKAVNLPIKKHLSKKNIQIQTLDFDLTKKINILTGANMAGKTSALRTIGQFAFLVSNGIPVPAEFCQMPMFDFIFFSGIMGDLAQMDLSSFGEEVVEINLALQQKGFGLFLIDELGRGTNPKEGGVFCRAILEEFSEKNAILFSASHFTEPAKISNASHFQIVGISESNFQKVKLDSNSSLQKRLSELHKYMDYSICEVEPDSMPPKAALMVAEILGVSAKIISKAKLYFENL